MKDRALRRGPASSTLLVGVASLLLGLAAGCGPLPFLRILAPGDGTEVTWMPIRIELDMAATLDPGTLVVRLNGSDVTSRFLFLPASGNRVVAFAEQVGAPELLQGTNILEASIPVPNETALPGPDGIAVRSVSFEATGDPYADDVESYAIGASGGFNQSNLPGVVTGPPSGGGLFNGGLDVLSLGSSGTIEMRFDDNAILDGPGPDFTVFENSFLGLGAQFVVEAPFAEPGRISVSQDGLLWFVFACDLVAQPLPLVAPYYPGCAGVYPVLSNAELPHPSIRTTEPIENLVGQNALTLPVPAGAGGDSFDLADLGLGWVRYVRVEAADFVQGSAGPDNFGFDLDAVVALHSVSGTDLDGNGVPDAVE